MSKKNPHIKPVSELSRDSTFTNKQQATLQRTARQNGGRPNQADSGFKPGTKADHAFAQKRVAGQPTWKAPSSTFTPNQAGSKFKPGSKADHAFAGLKPPKPPKAATFSPTTTASDIRRPSPRTAKTKKLGSGAIGIAATGTANAAMGVYDKLRAKKKGK